MKRASLELGVGIFVLVGLACLAYLAVHLGKMEVLGGGYRVVADFDNISGLKPGASVEVAGVEVGRVESIQIADSDRARLVLRMNPGVQLKDDAIASIRTKGIIGDKFVKLSPGSSEKTIPEGGRIRDTESAVEWEELISKYIHGKV
ncbi:MAG: outer membrane lipid asymmetry maintenance protein MlaD [Deltaproteobacteria bacterium]|nr:outer membrane lipid asymmetry maintenance protein MlaD [Deltaproteobacteria bacterium]